MDVSEVVKHVRSGKCRSLEQMANEQVRLRERKLVTDWDAIIGDNCRWCMVLWRCFEVAVNSVATE